MKKIIIFVVAVIVVLTVGAGYLFYTKKTVDPFAGLRPERASIIHVRMFPKRYEGKIITVNGYFSNNSKPLPAIYINEMYAKANDTSLGLIISKSGGVDIYDQVYNVYKYDNLDIIDGCFINVWGRVIDGAILTGNVSIYIDNKCKKRFKKSDIIIKGTMDE